MDSRIYYEEQETILEILWAQEKFHQGFTASSHPKCQNCKRDKRKSQDMVWRDNQQSACHHLSLSRLHRCVPAAPWPPKLWTAMVLPYHFQCILPDFLRASKSTINASHVSCSDFSHTMWPLHSVRCSLPASSRHHLLQHRLYSCWFL